jgi:hypothetical protein
MPKKSTKALVPSKDEFIEAAGETVEGREVRYLQEAEEAARPVISPEPLAL